MRPEAFSEEIYVSEVINGGQQLQLSNNTVYEIAPEDWAQAQAWIALTNTLKISTLPLTATPSPSTAYAKQFHIEFNSKQ